MLKHWRYRLEKGRPHLLLLVGLLVVIVGISVVGGALVFLAGARGSLGESIWWTFLHVSDPGYLGDAENPTAAVLGTVFTVLGMVTFMAGLVGILTSLITSGLKTLHEGGAPIEFRDHIVIIGWNSRVFALVADLLHADADNQVAILGRLDKGSAEKQLERRIFDPLARREGQRAARKARGNVVYRQGNTGADHDLFRVSAGEASRFVLLVEQAGASERAVDVAQIRTLYSVERAHAAGSDGRERFTTVVEFASEQYRSHAFCAMRIDPRLDAWVAYYEEQLEKRGKRSFLPTPASADSLNDMTAVNPDQIVSRVLVQCAIQPFLSTVYEEIFSFRGHEIFLWHPAAAWKTAWDEMLRLSPVDRPVYLAGLIKDGVVIGSIDGGIINFDTTAWKPLDAQTQVVVLGDKQAFRKRPPEQRKLSRAAAACRVLATPAQRRLRVLVLGTNGRLPLIVEQFMDYAEQYANTYLVIDVMDLCEFPSIPDYGHRVVVSLRPGDFTDWDVLGGLLEEEQPYDSIILLAEDRDIEDPEVDARVTLVLVMLRAFRDDEHWRASLECANLVAEVRDARNRSILRQENLAGDVIVGDEYVSGFVAQVCVDHRLEELYREILDYGHHEIYAREISVPEAGCTFADGIRACAAQSETAIGLLRGESDTTPRPILAPDLTVRITDRDLVLVVGNR